MYLLHTKCSETYDVGNTNKESLVTLTNMIIINISNISSPHSLLFHLRAAFNINKRQLFIVSTNFFFFM